MGIREKESELEKLKDNNIRGLDVLIGETKLVGIFSGLLLVGFGTYKLIHYLDKLVGSVDYNHFIR